MFNIAHFGEEFIYKYKLVETPATLYSNLPRPSRPTAFCSPTPYLKGKFVVFGLRLMPMDPYFRNVLGPRPHSANLPH